MGKIKRFLMLILWIWQVLFSGPLKGVKESKNLKTIDFVAAAVALILGALVAFILVDGGFYE